MKFSSVVTLERTSPSQGPCGPGLFEEQPGAQMANWLTFALGAMLRTDGCDISQEDVSAHTALARTGETKFRNFRQLRVRQYIYINTHTKQQLKCDEPCNRTNTT